ncbi:MAG: class I mannose-6-phosphate isomerase [Proteobacteria bacterium]|nr:class I mannose-6-phosphate isomerase [Pseudomonadota bacterium]
MNSNPQPLPPRSDSSLLALDNPILLSPTNFTPLSRTPWAGSELAATYKAQVVDSPEMRIGESWEFSCSSESPSRLAHDPSKTLSDVMRFDAPSSISLAAANLGLVESDILVKLLNANAPLSLQIHPADSHPALTHNECGKPETWLILDAAPGAGLFLGFSRQITLDELRSHLKANTFDPQWLQFVPVSKGDYFEIGPGVPHAIGPGLVILEPQRVSPGKFGKTWRLWDWNRKYNANGDLDQITGSPRTLHINESLSILSMETQVGTGFVDSLRRLPTIHQEPGIVISTFPANGYYQVVHGTMQEGTAIEFHPECLYGAFTLLKGNGEFQGSRSTAISFGHTAFLPNKCLPIIYKARSALSEWTLVLPTPKGSTSSRNIFKTGSTNGQASTALA